MSRRCSATFLAVATLWLTHNFCCARFTDTGVPCYLRPSADRCHYRAKPDSPTCTSADDRRRLTEGARQLNRSIAILEQKLIRLGVIPPDNACSKLSEVENGAVVYSDLNLGAGCVARYVCNEGYTLQSIRGQKEFVCDDYGIWNGDTSTAPVECLLTVDQCEQPMNITNGGISYEDDDPNNIFVGNRIEYHCANGTELHGSKYRFCQRNGNWSDSEPECKGVISKEEITSDEFKIGKIQIIEISLGVVFAVLTFIAVVIIIAVVVKLIRRVFKKCKEGRVRTTSGLTIIDQDNHEDSDQGGDSKDSVRYESFESRSDSTASSEVTVNVLKKSRKRSKKSKKSEFEELLM